MKFETIISHGEPLQIKVFDTEKTIEHNGTHKDFVSMERNYEGKLTGYVVLQPKSGDAYKVWSNHCNCQPSASRGYVELDDDEDAALAFDVAVNAA